MSEHDITSEEKRICILEDRMNAMARAIDSLRHLAGKAAQDSSLTPPPSIADVIYLARVTTAITSVSSTGDTAGAGQAKILQNLAGVAVNPSYPLQAIDNYIGDGTGATTIPLKTNIFVAKIGGRWTLIGGNCFVTSNP